MGYSLGLFFFPCLVEVQFLALAAFPARRGAFERFFMLGFYVESSRWTFTLDICVGSLGWAFFVFRDSFLFLCSFFCSLYSLLFFFFSVYVSFFFLNPLLGYLCSWFFVLRSLLFVFHSTNRSGPLSTDEFHAIILLWASWAYVQRIGPTLLHRREQLCRPFNERVQPLFNSVVIVA